MTDGGTGRSYARVYEGVKRGVQHGFLEAAISRSGGRVLSSSGPGRAPLFLSIECPSARSLAICSYTFLANHRQIRNRPPDEHRLQLRYGDVNSAAWRNEAHPVGFDPLGADTTLVLGVHPEADLIVALDPLVYDPLPLGISVFFKDAEVEAAQRTGWHVWERDNISGLRRAERRTELGLETLVAFRPERFLDYVRFEHAAQRLGLDPSLRFRAAEQAASPSDIGGVHLLELELGLSGTDILDIISERPRLGVAVRGGVAERHLQRSLEADPAISQVDLGQSDGPPDFVVQTRPRGTSISIECKNASPKTYVDGTPKVETQKTRTSKSDPKSRLYDPAQFDVIAASMFGPQGRWSFRFKRSSLLERDARFPDRIAPIQRIDGTWAESLTEALDHT